MIQKLLENFQQLSSNPIFAAGIGLGGFGLISFWIKDVPLRILDFIKRQATTDLIIHNYDSVFYDFLQWVKKENKKKNFRTLKVNNGRYGHDDAAISMGYGSHFVRYGSNILWVSYSQNKESVSDKVKETIVITKLGRGKKLFENIIEAVTKENIDDTTLKLYKMDGDWYFSKDTKKRYLDSIFIEKEKKYLITSNLAQFLQREEWYLNSGIPYQYGILLYGPPGTGKTSLIKAIASELNYDIHYLTPKKLSSIEEALSSCSEKSLVVVEDIDSNITVHNRDDDDDAPALNSKKPKKNKDKSSTDSLIESICSLNLSDVLNALDGLNSVHGRLLICTTNHLERLDKALIRPGRFDLLVEIGYVNNEILNQFLNHFFPEVKKYEDLEIKDKLTVAELQNMILLNYSREKILKTIKK